MPSLEIPVVRFHAMRDLRRFSTTISIDVPDEILEVLGIDPDAPNDWASVIEKVMTDIRGQHIG